MRGKSLERVHPWLGKRGTRKKKVKERDEVRSQLYDFQVGTTPGQPLRIHTHTQKKFFCFRNNKEGNEVSSTHRMMYILCVFVLLLTHSSKHNPSWLWRNNGALFVPTNNYLKTLYGDGLESRSFLSFDDDDDYTHQTVPELIITSKTTFRDAIKYIKLKLKCT